MVSATDLVIHNHRIDGKIIEGLFPKQISGVSEPELRPIKRPSNKKAGAESEVYAFSVDDARKLVSYFISKEKWIHYLAFTFECNMARRAGDTLKLKWGDLYDVSTGNIRKWLCIKEDKTQKIAKPSINSACTRAINTYIEKTGCDPAKNNYEEPVFMQLSGTYKGRSLSYDGFRKALKKACAELGVEYNVGTHSARKTFGAMSRMLHPNDHDSMEILRLIYNHSSARTTSRYIGLDKEKVDKYYDDIGEFYNRYIVDGEEYTEISPQPIVSIDSNELVAIIQLAYEAGMKNAASTDAMVHVSAITDILSLVEDASL